MWHPFLWVYLASQISLYESEWSMIEANISEGNLRMLETIFTTAKDAFDVRGEKVCNNKLTQVKQRLDQLGIEFPERSARNAGNR